LFFTKKFLKIKKKEEKMGKKKENACLIPDDYTIWRINTAPINDVLKIGEYVAGSDFFVYNYNNKKNPPFYKKDEGVRLAVKRAFAIGAFNHSRCIKTHLFSEESFLEFLKMQEEKRKEKLLALLDSFRKEPCRVCTLFEVCDEHRRGNCVVLRDSKQ
jgi:hypothetical protein